jgi:hypothetical protein
MMIWHCAFHADSGVEWADFRKLAVQLQAHIWYSGCIMVKYIKKIRTEKKLLIQ